MTALPVQLDPAFATGLLLTGSWTPLRVGLALAWAAAFVALLAVALGGWSLLDLSERRIRFVSAVTHELRTPLTTLRLYLDMLAGGMIKEEQQKNDYLQTLNAEADRLNRLVGNVLDFSRLENHRPSLAKTEVALPDLMEQVQSNWHGRCQAADKDLVLDNSVGARVHLHTDSQLLQQVLGNLIDNACKYSRGANDRRIWLRARLEGKRMILEVEDRGPGVPLRERRSIFRPFRRGRGSEVTAGGVGLGLALAHRWVHVLGGELTLQSCADKRGACFRVELPFHSSSPTSPQKS
jgi:signal transduction histidine kinase